MFAAKVESTLQTTMESLLRSAAVREADSWQEVLRILLQEHPWLQNGRKVEARIDGVWMPVYIVRHVFHSHCGSVFPSVSVDVLIIGGNQEARVPIEDVRPSSQSRKPGQAYGTQAPEPGGAHTGTYASATASASACLNVPVSSSSSSATSVPGPGPASVPVPVPLPVPRPSSSSSSNANSGPIPIRHNGPSAPDWRQIPWDVLRDQFAHEFLEAIGDSYDGWLWYRCKCCLAYRNRNVRAWWPGGVQDHINSKKHKNAKAWYARNTIE